MAVAVEMDFRGATTQQYDQIREKMGLTPGGGTPPGAISHWVAATHDGLHIVDVWESREAFDRFAQEKIGLTARRSASPIHLRSATTRSITTSAKGSSPDSRRKARLGPRAVVQVRYCRRVKEAHTGFEPVPPP
jgi:hypothetical protein